MARGGLPLPADGVSVRGMGAAAGEEEGRREHEGGGARGGVRGHRLVVRSCCCRSSGGRGGGDGDGQLGRAGEKRGVATAACVKPGNALDGFFSRRAWCLLP